MPPKVTPKTSTKETSTKKSPSKKRVSAVQMKSMTTAWINSDEEDNCEQPKDLTEDERWGSEIVLELFSDGVETNTFLDSRGNVTNEKHLWKLHTKKVVEDPLGEDRTPLFHEISDSKATYELPANIYTGLLLLPLLFDAEHLRVKKKKGEEVEEETQFFRAIAYCVVIQYVVAYAFCIFVQLSLIYFVALTTYDGQVFKTKKCGSEYWVLMAGFAAFFLGMVSDIAETMRVARWLYKVKRTDKFKPLPSDDCPVPEGHYVQLTLAHKIAGWFIVVAPKLVINLALIGYGPNFIADSEDNTAVILNCVAMTFVFELDDYCYQLFTPPLFKRAIDFEKTRLTAKSLDDKMDGDDESCADICLMFYNLCDFCCNLFCNGFLVLGLLYSITDYNYRATCGLYEGP